MTLIKSISGIRGTIGGAIGDNLTPIDAVNFGAAYATWLKQSTGVKNPTVVIGRDARLSGEMISKLVAGALQGCGVHVIDLGLSTTPTVEVAVPLEKAHGGIILTASHNPAQWNALKLLNSKGEFISGDEGAIVLKIAEEQTADFVDVMELGSYKQDDTYLQKHIDAVLNLPLVDVDAIKKANFTVAIDAVNSTGGIFIPALLKALGVNSVKPLFCEPTGHFPHNPEPLPAHLTDLVSLIKKEKVDVGFVVDPDVDRLAIVSEDGSMFGEEYTLVAVADYVLSQTKGNTVSNLSSTRALSDVTKKHGQNYQASAVGEVNVVELMKATNAVIGGEGNGGIIYPELHYGRDALVGIALFLTHLAKTEMKCSELRASYPNYEISKNKIELTPSIDVDVILVEIKAAFSTETINDIDGVKIDFADGWVHLRKSNTEPIIRVYAEAVTAERANELASMVMQKVDDYCCAK
jgi:phosphomannomutase